MKIGDYILYSLLAITILLAIGLFIWMAKSYHDLEINNVRMEEQLKYYKGMLTPQCSPEESSIKFM